MRGPCDHHVPVLQKQAWTGVLFQRIKRDFSSAATIAGAIHGRGNHDWTAEFFGVGHRVNRMQALEVNSVLLRFRDEVQGLGRRIDHRSAGDADFRHQVTAGNVAVRNGRDPGRGIDETLLPQHCSRVCIDGVNTVVLRGDVQHVVRPSGNVLHIRNVERLRVHIAVDSCRKELSELGAIHIAGGQGCFLCILTRP